MEILQSWLPCPVQYSRESARYNGGRSRPKAFAVQTLVEIGDVFAVTVVQERRPALAGANDFFARLAPARMRHLRIDVGPEAIFRWLQRFPHAPWTLVGEIETYDRLDRLESVFPRQSEPQGRAVLPRKRVSIGAGDEESEFVRGFRHRHAFHIGPRIPRLPLTGRHLRIQERFHSHI